MHADNVQYNSRFNTPVVRKQNGLPGSAPPRSKLTPGGNKITPYLDYWEEKVRLREASTLPVDPDPEVEAAGGYKSIADEDLDGLIRNGDPDQVLMDFISGPVEVPVIR